MLMTTITATIQRMQEIARQASILATGLAGENGCRALATSLSYFSDCVCGFFAQLVHLFLSRASDCRNPDSRVSGDGDPYCQRSSDFIVGKLQFSVGPSQKSKAAPVECIKRCRSFFQNWLVPKPRAEPKAAAPNPSSCLSQCLPHLSHKPPPASEHDAG